MAGCRSTKRAIAARLLPVLLPNFASGDLFPSAGVHRQSYRILCRIMHLAWACELGHGRAVSDLDAVQAAGTWPAQPALSVPS